MKTRRSMGFTLIEIMIAITIFGLVVAAMYSSWIAVLRATRVGLEATAEAQRSRVAMRLVEEALASARLFEANPAYYSFLSGEDGGFSAISFSARLPPSYPRSGRYFGQQLRRVSFRVEPHRDHGEQLVLRQQPLLTDMDIDEEETPLVLARHVREFLVEYYDVQNEEWASEWVDTNSLPPLVRFTLATANNDDRDAPATVATRLVAIPGMGVPANLQVPQARTPRTSQRGISSRVPATPLNPAAGSGR